MNGTDTNTQTEIVNLTPPPIEPATASGDDVKEAMAAMITPVPEGDEKAKAKPAKTAKAKAAKPAKTAKAKDATPKVARVAGHKAQTQIPNAAFALIQKQAKVAKHRDADEVRELIRRGMVAKYGKADTEKVFEV